MLWKALYPTQWTRGVWSFDYIPPKDSDITLVNQTSFIFADMTCLVMEQILRSLRR